MKRSTYNLNVGQFVHENTPPIIRVVWRKCARATTTSAKLIKKALLTAVLRPERVGCHYSGIPFVVGADVLVINDSVSNGVVCAGWHNGFGGVVSENQAAVQQNDPN